MQHGEDYSGQGVAGWLMSEKLRGCRVYWDGVTLWSRGGLALTVPSCWTLPPFPIDCELYDGLDGERRCATAIKARRIACLLRVMQ